MRKKFSWFMLVVMLCGCLVPSLVWADQTAVKHTQQQTSSNSDVSQKTIIGHSIPSDEDDAVATLAKQIVAHGLAGDQDFIRKAYDLGLDGNNPQTFASLDSVKKPVQKATNAVVKIATMQAQAYLAQKPTLDLIANYNKQQVSGGKTAANPVLYNAYWAGNTLVLQTPQTPQTLLDAIARLPQVKTVASDSPVTQPEVIKPTQPFGMPRNADRSVRMFRSVPTLALPNEIEENLKAIRANKVWDELNIDGSGVTVGIIDQQVDVSHPALKTKYRGYDATTGQTADEGNYIDYVKSPYPSDHGSHVAGIIVGSEAHNTNRIGVAPGAKFIVASTFRDGVGASNENIIKACQWMMAPAGDPTRAPKIVNHSWSDGTNKIDPWFDNMARQMRSVGILNVMSSGNNGSELAPAGSIDNPAGLAEIFSVGACDNTGRVAAFSRRGPVLGVAGADARIKPDVVAPGVGVRSAIHGRGYVSWDGTSMAAPHVSGVAALVWSANPALTLEEVEQILRSSAQANTDATYPNSPNMAYGYGCVDAYNAVRMALAKKNTSGDPAASDPAAHDTATGADLSSLNVTVKGAMSPISVADGDVLATMATQILSARPYALEVTLKHPQNFTSVFVRVTPDASTSAVSGTGSSNTTKTYEFLGSAVFNDPRSYRIAFKNDAAPEGLPTGSYKVSLVLVDTTGTEHVSQAAPLTVREALNPDEYVFDFERGACGFAFAGDFSAGIANLQIDAKPTSGVSLMGLKLGVFSLGTQPTSTAQLPQLDLRGGAARDAQKIELVFQEYLDWDQAVAGMQLELNPKEGPAQNLFNYPVKLTVERGKWVERRVDLTAYKGKLVNPFVFAVNSEKTAGTGLYIDDVRLELDGVAATKQGLAERQGLGGFTTKAAVASNAPSSAGATSTAAAQGTLIANVELLGAGLRGQTNNAGSYTFRKVKQGSYELLVGATGYKSQKLNVVLNKGANTLEVTLEKDPAYTQLDPHAKRPTADPGTGIQGFAYDNNNPLGGAILHSKPGRATAVKVQAPADGVLSHVMVYAAGNNPILSDGAFEISIKQYNALGRLIDLMQPQVVQAQCGRWNRFDFKQFKLAMAGDVYVVVKQLRPQGKTPAVGLDKSVARNSDAYSNCFIYNGDFNTMASGGYFGVPMIRAYFATNDNVHTADPQNPSFDSAISLVPVADPLREEGQKPKDIVTIGDYDISPSRGMIVKYHKLAELYNKQPVSERILKVPATIGGVKITQIGAGAYKAPSWQGGELARVEIPEGICCIHEAAFEKSGAHEVILPSTVEFIYGRAFKKAKFTNIKLPTGLKHIGESAFEECSELLSIDIPDSVETIERGAFKGSSFGAAMKLAQVKLPNNPKFTFIPAQLFFKNVNLKNITIPTSVKEIRFSAFEKAGLESLVLPEGVTSIGESAFNACALKRVELPDSLEEIGNDAFAGSYVQKNSIAELRLPARLRSIGRGAFEGNVITKLILPASVETLRMNAFADNPLAFVQLNPTIAPETNPKPGVFRGLSPKAFSKVSELRYYADSQITDDLKQGLGIDPATPKADDTKFVKLGESDTEQLQLLSAEKTFALLGEKGLLKDIAELVAARRELASDELQAIASLRKPYRVSVVGAYDVSALDAAHNPVALPVALKLAMQQSAVGTWNHKALAFKPAGSAQWIMLPYTLAVESTGLASDTVKQSAVFTLSRLGTVAVLELTDPADMAPNPADIDYGVLPLTGYIAPVKPAPVPDPVPTPTPSPTPTPNPNPSSNITDNTSNDDKPTHASSTSGSSVRRVMPRTGDATSLLVSLVGMLTGSSLVAVGWLILRRKRMTKERSHF